MKKVLQNLSMLFVAIAFVACNSGTNESATSENESAAAAQNDTTIVIASLAGGAVSFVADAEILRNDWQKFLTQQKNGANYNLENVEIVFNEEAKKYYLHASGTQDSLVLKASIGLRNNGQNCLALSGQTLMCSASGTCATDVTGCLPSDTYCTKCADENGACAKMVSNTPTAMFPSLKTGGCLE